MIVEISEKPAWSDLPKFDGVIGIARSEPCSIRREHHRAGEDFEATERWRECPRLDAPEVDTYTLAEGECAAIRGNSDGLNRPRKCMGDGDVALIPAKLPEVTPLETA